MFHSYVKFITRGCIISYLGRQIEQFSEGDQQSSSLWWVNVRLGFCILTFTRGNQVNSYSSQMIDCYVGISQNWTWGTHILGNPTLRHSHI